MKHWENGAILDKLWVRESNLYDIYDSSKKLVRCTICERKCVIAPDKTGAVTIGVHGAKTTC